MLEVKAIDLFYGAAQALRGISLNVEPGKVTCVLGRNGVGKSSLLRAIAGQHPIAKGEIVLNGQNINTLSPSQRARLGIGYVPQGREIFPLLTVAENLETGFAPLPRSERYVPDDVYSLFPVLKDMLRRRGGDLSGGQQQQLAIARALVMRPKVLVLDEPTEGIQPSIIKDIGNAIRYLRDQPSIVKEIGDTIRYLRDRGDIAILLVEQYFDFARELADSFAVMDRGQFVLTGDREAMQSEDVRRRISL